MQLLKERILKDGVVKPGNILKVDSFLNHQMDIKLFAEIGREFKRRFADCQINKILTIEASGMAVGLPDGQMGNSEVGHTNIGAGRVVYQELTRITKSIQDGDFFENPALLKAMENAKKPGRQSVLPAFGL